jgi:hypothetical protein
MLSGFNTNFRYRGVLFHVQTEDSGKDNPHVITHLFHGGNIMASQKRDYSALLADADADVEDSIRKLMEGQHKSMLKQLSRGMHDAVIGQRLGSDVFQADPDSQIPPPSVTEETRLSAQSEPTEGLDEPPLVLAEHTNIAAHSVLADSFGAESILEPEFATELPPARAQSEPATSEPAEGETRKSTQLSRVFGDRVVSEKPLDEVVMDYLVDNARKRKRPPK